MLFKLEIFKLEHEFKIIDYENENIHFEIFVSNQQTNTTKKVEHICLEVANLDLFLERCDEIGVNVLRIPKGVAFITFIKDFGGNFFEIKEKQ